MNLDNQKEYWDKVAQNKTFTHPINLELINKYLTKESLIIDYGCGYGRIINELIDHQFYNVKGFDTSKELILRGVTEKKLPIYHIEDPTKIDLENNSVDCFLLFAVLTCIPSNEGQLNLINLLLSKLKKGGILYISDYYLQENSVEVERYHYLNDDNENFGVFTLPEGATFRHHTKEWISSLTKDFTLLIETPLEVKTMNGNIANGFQLIIKK